MHFLRLDGTLYTAFLPIAYCLYFYLNSLFVSFSLIPSLLSFSLFLLLSCSTLSSFSFSFSCVVSYLLRFIFYIFLQFPFLHFILYSFQLLSSVLSFLVFLFFSFSSIFSPLLTICVCHVSFWYHSLNYFSHRSVTS